MVSLPSFAQTSPCPIGTANCTLPNGQAIPPDSGTPWWWGGIGGGGNSNTGNSGGACWAGDPSCRSDDGDSDYDPPEVCTYTEELNLRTQKQNIDGCYGDPGNTFNIIQWYDNETSFWNQVFDGTFPGGLFEEMWYDSFIGSIAWLGEALINNNGNQIAPYGEFEHQMWMSCITYIGDQSEYDNCNSSVLFILDSYYPGVNIANYILNYFGADLPTTDFSGTWGGRLTEDLNNFKRCQLVYRAWDEQNCGGNL